MKQKIKQLLCLLLACQLFTGTAWARPDWPADTGIQAEAGIVMDADSGAILFGQNIHVPYPPASITKILTALIVLEHAQPDEMVTFTENACNSVESDSGNKLGVVPGDTLTVEDCLYGLLLVFLEPRFIRFLRRIAASSAIFSNIGTSGSYSAITSGSWSARIFFTLVYVIRLSYAGEHFFKCCLYFLY